MTFERGGKERRGGGEEGRGGGEEGRRGGGEGEDTHVMQSDRERNEHFVAVTYNVVPSSEEGEESGDNGRHA